MTDQPLAVVPVAFVAFLEAFNRQCREQGVPPHVQVAAHELFVETLASQTARGLIEYRQPLLFEDNRDAFEDAAQDAVDAWLYVVRMRGRLELHARRIRELDERIAALDAEKALLDAKVARLKAEAEQRPSPWIDGPSIGVAEPEGI